MICRTLSSSSPGNGATLATATRSGRRSRAAQAPLVSPGGAEVHAPSRPLRHQLLAILAVVVLGGTALWAFSGLFSLAFHIGELVAVALVAGWAGYRAGHFQGRRSH
jgi:hypothetical protein